MCKVFLNLDKGFNYIGLVYPLLKKHDMYDWHIKNRINIIQSDRPALLIDFLRNKKEVA